MTILMTIQSQLGLMTWPIALLSFLTAMILIERVFFLTLNSFSRSKTIIKKMKSINVNNDDELNLLISQSASKKDTLSQGVVLLLSHKKFNKQLREETVSIWLVKKRQHYTSGLKFLSVIGVISPLIGLLGTVLGLIEMFKDLSATSGSVSPADLAQGLGLAMSTTAAGLIIAVPAIFGSQILQLWADRTVGKIEHVLNHCNLYIEGISLEKNRAEIICSRASRRGCHKPEGEITNEVSQA